MKVLLFIVLILTSQAWSMVLTWDQCVKEALENNPEIKASRAQSESTRHLEKVAGSGLLPQLSATLGYSRATASAADPAQPYSDWGDWHTGTIKLTQNLFNGFQDIEKLRAARSATRASLASLQILKAQISLNLKTAFQGLVYAKAFEKLTQDIVKRRQENLKIVQLRFQSGRENKGSVLLSQANLDQANLDVLQAKHLREVAASQLRKALGFDESKPLDISGVVPVANWNGNEPDFESLAQKSPAYLQAELQAEGKDHEMLAAKGPFYPQLSLTGEYGSVGPTFYPSIPHWSFGVNLTYSLFNGLKDSGQYRSAAEAKGQFENQRINAIRNTVVTLRKTYSDLTESIEKVNVDRAFREAAVIRSEIARKKYNNGLLSFEEWDIIETDLITREKNYLQSSRDRVVNEANFENAEGSGAIP